MISGNRYNNQVFYPPIDPEKLVIEVESSRNKYPNLTWDQIAGKFFNGRIKDGDSLRKRYNRAKDTLQKFETLENQINTVEDNLEDMVHYQIDNTNDFNDRLGNIENAVQKLVNIMNGNRDAQQNYTKQAAVQIEDYDEEDLYEEYASHDNDKWLAWLGEKEKTEEYLNFLILNDLHIPDHSHNALSVIFELLAYLKPDAVIFGGDIADFDLISRWKTNHRRVRRDVLVEFANHWNPLIDKISRIVPDVPLIAIGGNHEARFDALASDMSDIGFSLENLFVDKMRSNNRVWWLGEKQETNICGNIVQHGKSTGKYAARKALEKLRVQTTQVSGHSHTPDTYMVRESDRRDINNYRVVTSVITGTLSNIPASYQTDTDQSGWFHSVAHMTVHIPTEEASVSNIVFHQDGKRLWTAYGDRILSSH
jgi:predicted phosphodiesterase/ElaB/YqjD/DUF883 family membrane-anchored ribosome-binding protein